MNNLNHYLKGVVEDHDLTLNMLPNLDLYMDQVISLFEQTMVTKGQEEKPLTKTMINNYSKERLLLPIKGKTYSPAHIMQLQIIYNLKQCLPLKEVKALMNYISEEVINDEKEYNYEKVRLLSKNFLIIKQGIRESLPDMVDETFATCFDNVSEIDMTETHAKALDVLFLTTLSKYCEQAALEIIKTLPSPKE